MILAIRFFAVGYGVAAVLGLMVALALGLHGTAIFLGVLTAWIGGGVLSLVVAYGWWRGYWMRPDHDTPNATEHGASESEAAADYSLWDRDLAAERFAADLADAPEREEKRRRSG